MDADTAMAVTKIPAIPPRKNPTINTPISTICTPSNRPRHRKCQDHPNGNHQDHVFTHFQPPLEFDCCPCVLAIGYKFVGTLHRMNGTYPSAVRCLQRRAPYQSSDIISEVSVRESRCGRTPICALCKQITDNDCSRHVCSCLHCSRIRYAHAHQIRLEIYGETHVVGTASRHRSGC